ncbi:hypothetical protein AAEO56_17325 [Flavobacterium sp. DGU11]|uniref:Uncharacterized protein n=1 Tax=Flavobacterium arundinis TaxID=3139143 RepID=A0ABU9I1Y2_9FLAO
MSIFSEILERSKLNSELIGLWKYNDDDGFWCGSVIDYNDEIITIQHYTKFGKKDGIFIAQSSDIESVDFNDDYAIAMRYLIENANELDNQGTIDQIILEEDWQYEVLNQVSGSVEKIVSVEINGDSYYSGFVQRVTEVDFVMLCVGKMGENEGLVLRKVADITGFKINDLDNRKRLMLYNWRNANK